MKTIRNIHILLSLFAVFSLCSCADDILGIFEDGDSEEVTLKLSYQGIKNTEVTLTRATDAENALNNLQVFIFDANTKKLKGYKYLTKESLNQTGEVANVEVKTTTGEAYVYGVANATTAIYKLITDKIPLADGQAWSETNAMLGTYDFTLDDLKAIAFNRQKGQKDITESNFMMSGAANDGNVCTIKSLGNGSAGIAETNNVIELHRIVAKIKFTVNTGEKTDRKITFTPTSYDICNVPIEGSLIEGAGTTANNSKPATFENFTGQTYSTETPNVFEVYLPENLQTAKLISNNWDDRELDEKDKNGEKAFKNAPDNGTYVVLNGTYTEKDLNGNLTRDAVVKYYIHLGYWDDTERYNDFNLNRNYSYNYTVTVKGVDKIVAQVEKQDDSTQPGAEGMVFDYKYGKRFTLDSHYNEINLTFNQSDIQDISTDPEEKNQGYRFKVIDIDGTSDVCNVSDKLYGNLNRGDNSTDVTWVRFVAGADKSVPSGGLDQEGNSLSLIEMLKELYTNRDNDSFWTNGQKTYTCFVNENYYEDRSWDEYVNKDPRQLYIANSVEMSADGRSIYAVGAYSISQYPIYTFYNPAKANDSSIIPYGVETISDDDTKQKTLEYDKSWKTDIQSYYPNTSHNGKGTDSWNGYNNFKKDLGISERAVTSWPSDNDLKDFVKSCMSRNRDLDGDGYIDGDEVRWYVPAIDQYAGLWIGAEALATNAHLFTGNTSDIEKFSETNFNYKGGMYHYFSNTENRDEFWAEETMCISNSASNRLDFMHVRCIRNLESKGKGTNVEPTKYYTLDTTNKTIDLSNINSIALRTSVQENGYNNHNENSITNKPRIKFKYAANRLNNAGTVTHTTINNAIEGNNLCSSYSEDGIEKWRVPNQRELGMLYITNNANYCNADDNFGDKANYSGGIGCCTNFSNFGIRKSWWVYKTGDNTYMLGLTNEGNKDITIRCVKDVQ